MSFNISYCFFFFSSAHKNFKLRAPQRVLGYWLSCWGCLLALITGLKEVETDLLFSFIGRKWQEEATKHFSISLVCTKIKIFKTWWILLNIRIFLHFMESMWNIVEGRLRLVYSLNFPFTDVDLGRKIESFRNIKKVLNLHCTTIHN